MLQNYYQVSMFAKEHTEDLKNEARQHEQVLAARQANAANKQPSGKLSFQVGFKRTAKATK
jgi:hypothetical protein